MYRRLLLLASLLLVDDIAAFVSATTEAVPSGLAVSVAVRQCYQCSSHGPGGAFNPQCPVDSGVLSGAYLGPCRGLCFTRTIGTADPTLVYRGCMEGQYGFPDPLPTEGCYTWTARSQLWCFCSTDGCNAVKLGLAGNTSLEDYADQQKDKDSDGGGGGQSNHTGVLPPSFHPGADSSGVLQCWQCLSQDERVSNPQCPVHGQVDVIKTYFGNCTGRCYMSSWQDSSGVEVMHRGCTSDKYGLPDPLPTEGCFPWTARSQLWCFCSSHGCNGVRMGEAGNQSLEQFVQQEKDKETTDGHSTDAVLPPSVLPGVLQCWECQSYLNGRNYSQCPRDDRVNVNTVYIGNCTGRCIMHSALDRPTLLEVMYRGCSSTLYGLPDPLPADGCYSWKGEVWCVCSTTGCNGVKLGVPGAQFDPHLSNKGHMVQGTAVLLLTLFSWSPFF